MLRYLLILGNVGQKSVLVHTGLENTARGKKGRKENPNR